MSHLKFKILFLFCLMVFHFVNAQEGYVPYSAVACSTCRVSGTTPPPVASAAEYAGYELPATLGDYGTTPVDLYSGSPSINIPLYTIQTHNFSLPISLSYNSSGIKVDQEANWVGLGWNLNAGPSITRIIRGGDDFVTSTNGTDDPLLYSAGLHSEYYGDGTICPGSCVSNSRVAYVDGTRNNEKDLQADIFSFNVPGYSGKFILEPTRNQNRQVFLLEKEKIQVILTYTTNVQVPTIQITTPDGTNYVYGEVPGGSYSTLTYMGSRSYTDLSTVQTTIHLDDGTTQTTTTNIATAWNLQKITTPAKEVINFNYYYSSYSSPTIQSETYVYNSLSDLQNVTANKKTVVDNSTSFSNAHLSLITFPLGKVVFNKSTSQRGDLQGQFSLSNISIYNNLNTNDFVKRYQFYYDYFNNGLIANVSAKDYVRLKLTNLKEVDAQSGNEAPGYSFNYNESINCGTYAGVTLSLPFKKSMGRDHWGFFNNQNAAETILKPTKEQVIVNVGGTNYNCNFDGLLRDVSVNYLQAGILTQISYPTGGFTQYTFEPNDYYSMNNIQKIVGGLRIKQVKASDGVSGKDTYTLYKYWVNDYQYNPTTTSSGVLLQDIMYTRVPANSSSGWPVYRSSNNVLPQGTHCKGSIVGYSEVTVLSGQNGELGKTINNYYALPNYYYESLSISQFNPNYYYAHVYDMVQKMAPSYLGETSTLKKYAYVKNGLLKKAKSFKKLGSAYVLTAETSNTYNNDGIIDVVPTGTLLLTNVELASFITITRVGWCCGHTTSGGSCDDVRTITTYTCDNVEILSFLTPYNYKIKLTSSIRKDYDQSDVTKFITKATTYEYANDNHMQLTMVCNDNGGTDGATCIQYTYPQDYSYISSPYEIRKVMAANFIHNATVETIYKRKIGGTYQITKASFNQYDFTNLGGQYNPNPIIIRKVFKLYTSVPLTETANTIYNTTAGYFINSVNKSTPTSYAMDDNYSSTPSITNSVFDNTQNLNESLNEANLPSSTIWGYSGSYQIAQATNAYRDQISYTGFESGNGVDDDNWSRNYLTVISKSDPNNSSNVFSGYYGVKVLQSAMGGSLVKEIIPASQKGKYKFSCMIKTSSLTASSAKIQVHTQLPGDVLGTVTPNISQAQSTTYLPNTNGTWQYFEVVFDFDLVKQLDGQSRNLSMIFNLWNPNSTNLIYIDEVRIQPIDAQMTTYSYLPLVGKTSASDANNRTTFTEYDGLRRIKNIRDQEQNILKRYNYYYKNQ